MKITIDKEYETIKEDRMEMVNEDGKLVEKTTKIDVRHAKYDTSWAMQQAEKRAKKEGYLDVSLLFESAVNWQFQLYNKKEVKDK